MTSLRDHHNAQAAKARGLYEAAQRAVDGAADWKFALAEARRLIIAALKASNSLQDIASALQASGSHMLVFRHFMAPPISQDQFKLVCKAWPKSSEKSGSSVDAPLAAEVAATFSAWRERFLTRWLDSNRKPTLTELRQALTAISPLIASQRIATARRTRIAYQQEHAIIDLLQSAGWTKLPSKVINGRGTVPPKHFMHKTRFATADGTSQEVDIACGLKNTVVLAMECKVTNDETNSVKRINDVAKKAAAWKLHYGNFVKTAALLQGVIAAKDVGRLIDGDILVFWSHDLDAFGTWLASEL